MEEKLYKQKDLIDQCTIKKYGAVEGYGRSAMIKAALPEEAELQTYSTDGYQGKMAFVIRLEGEIWLHNDYFGSCSYCDSFIDNQENWTEKMMRKAYCFDSEENAIEYLETTEDHSWNGYEPISRPTIEMVKDPENNKVRG